MGGPNSGPWIWEEDVTVVLVKEEGEEEPVPIFPRKTPFLGGRTAEKPTLPSKFCRRVFTN